MVLKYTITSCRIFCINSSPAQSGLCGILLKMSNQGLGSSDGVMSSGLKLLILESPEVVGGLVQKQVRGMLLRSYYLLVVSREWRDRSISQPPLHKHSQSSLHSPFGPSCPKTPGNSEFLWQQAKSMASLSAAMTFLLNLYVNV